MSKRFCFCRTLTCDRFLISTSVLYENETTIRCKMLCFKYPPLLIPKDPFWRWNRGLKFYDLIQGSNGGKLERLFMIWFCILRSCDLPCVWSPNWVWFEMWGYKFQCLKFGWADMKCLWEYFTFLYFLKKDKLKVE